MARKQRTPTERKRHRPTGIGRRLNEVWELVVGAADLKAFYTSLKGSRIPGFPSYPAVCTYHASPWRDPGTVYLTRIVEIYPQISMHWLVTGTGSRTVGRDPQAIDEDTLHGIRLVWDAILRNLPLPENETLWINVADDLLYSHGRGDLEIEEADQILAKVAALWLLPLEMFGRDVRQMTEAELNAFGIAMFAVMTTALPRDRAGREHALKSIARHPIDEG